MKKHILLFLLMLFIPWNAWSSSNSLSDEDEGYFKAFVPLNGNDSIEMTFYIISEEEKTVFIGYWGVCVDTSVKGEIQIPSLIKGYTVVSVSREAFSGCNELTSITIPPTVTYIGSFAFENCQNLDSIIILCSTLPDIENLCEGCLYLDMYYGLHPERCDPFSENNSIYVPASLIESYKKSKEWGYLSNQIYAIEGKIDYDVQVCAQSNSSDVSSRIGENNLAHIVSLKLSGSINGYDIKVIREQMPILRHLDLSDVDIVGNDYVYFTNENGKGYHTIDNYLGDYFFYNMQNLNDIKLPNNINGFGESVFEDCNNLKVVTLNIQNPLPITETTFFNRTEISLSVPSKEEYLIADFWKDFKEIIDDSDIINFADKTVENICISNWDTNEDGKLSKSEVEIVQSIGNIFAHTEITSFNELQYFTGLKEISGRCFEGCSNLTSLFIPENVTTISGDGIHLFGNQYYFSPFYGCDGLKEVHISNLKSWMNIDFGRGWSDPLYNPLYYAHHLYMDGQEITDLVIPEDVTIINPSVFAGCLGITSITIPNSVTSIGDYAFSDCLGFTSVTIPNSVTSIGTGAFYDCI